MKKRVCDIYQVYFATASEFDDETEECSALYLNRNSAFCTYSIRNTHTHTHTNIN